MESNMKSKAVMCAIMALSLVTGSYSFAQGSGLDADRNATPRGGQSQQRTVQPERRDRQIPQRNHVQNQERSYNQARAGERGAGPDHQFYRGGRLPAQYRTRHYVVNDWRGHHLSAPPRGYHWVQAGGDYVLVAIATGVILQLMLNN
jgi:Ni/Co efflux regulator RcnB